MKPWIKFHRNRSRRFEALPLITRGLFAEMLIHADDAGCIHLGTSDQAALWRLMGAHPRERQHLSKHLSSLVKAGAVSASEDGWSIPSFDRYQAKRSRDDSADDPPVTSDDPAAEPLDTGGATGSDVKPPEPLTFGPGDKRGEEREREKKQDAAGESAAAANYEAARKAAESALRVAIRTEVERVTGSWPSGLQLDYARQLSGWLVSWMSCESCPRGVSMDEVAAGVLHTFAEAKRRDRKMPPFSWLAEAPATWAERWVEETGRRRVEQRKDRKRAELQQRKRAEERKAEAEAVPMPPEFAAVMGKLADAWSMPGSAPVDMAERQRRLREQAERLAAGGSDE